MVPVNTPLPPYLSLNQAGCALAQMTPQLMRPPPPGMPQYPHQLPQPTGAYPYGFPPPQGGAFPPRPPMMMPPPPGAPRPPPPSGPPGGGAPPPPSGAALPPPPPSGGEPDAKRARTDFVLQPEEEFLDAHPGQSKVCGCSCLLQHARLINTTFLTLQGLLKAPCQSWPEASHCLSWPRAPYAVPSACTMSEVIAPSYHYVFYSVKDVPSSGLSAYITTQCLSGNQQYRLLHS